MPLKPPSRDDDQIYALWPPGQYDFEVMRAEEIGRPKGTMLKLKIKVFDEQRGTTIVWDYLIDWAMKFRLLHFLECTGLQAMIDDQLPVTALDVAGRTGSLQLVIEESPKWGSSNKVKDYISPGTDARNRKPEDAKLREMTVANAEDQEPDLPF